MRKPLIVKSFRIPDEFIKLITKYAKDHNLNESDVVRLALTNLFNEKK